MKRLPVDEAANIGGFCLLNTETIHLYPDTFMDYGAGLPCMKICGSLTFYPVARDKVYADVMVNGQCWLSRHPKYKGICVQCQSV